MKARDDGGTTNRRKKNGLEEEEWWELMHVDDAIRVKIYNIWVTSTVIERVTVTNPRLVFMSDTKERHPKGIES